MPQNFMPASGFSDLSSGKAVKALLGPTNTGKTHYAIERMALHRTGMIGLPLRLLAREVYQRMCDRVGVGAVALVTGEEKLQPPNARYFICTVEAMPRVANTDFVAIDEVQLASDLDRGHIFTDRILNLRGREETLLLGAATMAPILRKLIPNLEVIERPRLSTLAYAGSKKITRLPRRTAIVAFSADEVYAIAELVRRQRGGAAVVMGALSPRTRNAQVDLYQNGDVEYLVATDAIGMGLNLDVDHVAFAQDHKFDGHTYRQLTPAEYGQIGGRAGRHLTNGTFGVTGQVAPLEMDLVERIETHNFDSVKVLQWRNNALDFTSIAALKASLDVLPIASGMESGLTRAVPSTDQTALDFLTRDEEIVKLTDNKSRVQKLWDVCALPDYRKIAPAQHAEIIAALYRDLCKRGHVDEDYMADQVKKADNTAGEIDTLSHRVAQIRTWTYVSHRAGWLRDSSHWKERTRAIEDRLSDALHEQLTKRFVDRRTSVLMKRLRENAMLEATVDINGHVTVEGHPVGELKGFRFTADRTAEGPDAKAIQTAAQKALALEFEARAARFSVAPNGDITLGNDGKLRWLGAPVGTLAAGDTWLAPRLVLLADEHVSGPSRDRVTARLERFVAHHIETLIKPLIDLADAEQLQGMGRGVAFRLSENQGSVPRKDIADDIKTIDKDGRAALRRYGVRFGFYNIFIPALLKPAPAELITLLWALKNDALEGTGYGDPVNQLAAGRTSFVPDAEVDKEFYRLAGYELLGKRAVRIDILERLADLIRPALFWKPAADGASEERPEAAYGSGAFFVTPAMMSILGATADDMEAVLAALGYRSQPVTKPNFDSALAKLDADIAAKNAGKENPEAAPKVTVEVKAARKAVIAPATKPASDSKDTPTADLADTTLENAPAETGTAEPENTPEADAVPPVLIWRQARIGGNAQRENQNSNRNKRTNKAADGAAAPDQTGEKADAKPNEQGKRRFDNKRGGGKPNRDSSNRGKPDGNKGNMRDKNARGNNNQRPNRPVEKPLDPNSPFAKLAALKEKMKS